LDDKFINASLRILCEYLIYNLNHTIDMGLVMFFYFALIRYVKCNHQIGL